MKRGRGWQRVWGGLSSLSSSSGRARHAYRCVAAPEGVAATSCTDRRRMKTTERKEMALGQGHQVLKDGGRWSRALDGFFPAAPHLGWYFPSTLSLRRALADSLSTPPVGSSSSAALPTGRGVGRVGKKGKGTGRGGGRGRSRRTVEPSSPPPQPHSPEHRTTMADPFAEEATGTPVQEPGVDGHSSHETPVQDQPRVEVHSAHETTVPEASPDVERLGWDTWPDRTELPDWTEGPVGSGGGDGGDEFTDNEVDVHVDGATMYKRGSTRLPVVPATREQRPVIKPEGYRGWAHPRGIRRPNSVLGVLCPTNFPGFVTLPGEGQTFYRCEDGYEEEASKVLEAECRRLLQNLRHEARPRAIRDYYATRGIKKQKKDCRGKFLKKEQYMKVPPRWCADKMDCWDALVDEWCTGSWRAVHENAKDRRSQMAHHNKTEMPHFYDLYGMAHTASYKKAKAFSESDLDDTNNFTNISYHHKLVTYRDTRKATKGDDFNPSQEPLDPELVMISGGGRPHGSTAIGDGIIRCPLTLSEIKARESSSCPEITRRPRPVDLSIEAALQKERAVNQAALAKERLASQAALQAALDERDQTTTRLIEEERARNEAGQRALYELFVVSFFSH
ncbi:hypothetical protein ZWY2020_052480 [Hordeum vulgare]|nr:hypothetical protein ZWY2020_052480 [Hordeum vulgare]